MSEEPKRRERSCVLELLRFVEIALGSHNELDAHLRLGLDAGVIAEGDYTTLKAISIWFDAC